MFFGVISRRNSRLSTASFHHKLSNKCIFMRLLGVLDWKDQNGLSFCKPRQAHVGHLTPRFRFLCSNIVVAAVTIIQIRSQITSLDFDVWWHVCYLMQERQSVVSHSKTVLYWDFWFLIFQISLPSLGITGVEYGDFEYSLVGSRLPGIWTCTPTQITNLCH